MKTVEGTNLQCAYTGKICYTQREAGIVINDCKKHRFYGKHSVKVGYGNSKSISRRKYYCKDCGYYHVTHICLCMTGILKTMHGRMCFIGKWHRGKGRRLGEGVLSFNKNIFSAR